MSSDKPITARIEVVRGMKSKTIEKTFKNQAALDAYFEKHDEDKLIAVEKDRTQESSPEALVNKLLESATPFCQILAELAEQYDWTIIPDEQGDDDDAGEEWKEPNGPELGSFSAENPEGSTVFIETAIVDGVEKVTSAQGVSIANGADATLDWDFDLTNPVAAAKGFLSHFHDW